MPGRSEGELSRYVYAYNEKNTLQNEIIYGQNTMHGAYVFYDVCDKGPGGNTQDKKSRSGKARPKQSKSKKIVICVGRAKEVYNESTGGGML